MDKYVLTSEKAREKTIPKIWFTFVDPKKKRYLLRRVPGGYLGWNLKPEPNSSFYTRTSPANITSGRNLHWTTCLTTERPACPMFLQAQQALIKNFLELYFNQSDRSSLYLMGSVQLYPHQHLHWSSILTNQDSAFWTKLQGFEVLICTRTNESGIRGGDFCIYKPAPLWLPFSTKDRRAGTLKMK